MKSILTAALLFSASLLHADVPALINYQGLLTDINGNVITGNKTVSISIHDASTNGAQLYIESIGSVTVQNGIYSFQFGSGPTFTTTLATGSQHWLQVTLDGIAQTPRERLVSVPFAMKAAEAERLTSSTRKMVITAAYSYQGDSLTPPPYYLPVGSSTQTRIRAILPPSIEVLKSVKIRASNLRPRTDLPLGSITLRVIRRSTDGTETNVYTDAVGTAQGTFDLQCVGDAILDHTLYQYFVEVFIPTRSSNPSGSDGIEVTYQ